MQAGGSAPIPGMTSTLCPAQAFRQSHVHLRSHLFHTRCSRTYRKTPLLPWGFAKERALEYRLSMHDGGQGKKPERGAQHTPRGLELLDAAPARLSAAARHPLADTGVGCAKSPQPSVLISIASSLTHALKCAPDSKWSLKGVPPNHTSSHSHSSPATQLNSG